MKIWSKIKLLFKGAEASSLLWLRNFWQFAKTPGGLLYCVGGAVVVFIAFYFQKGYTVYTWIVLPFYAVLGFSRIRQPRAFWFISCVYLASILFWAELYFQLHQQYVEQKGEEHFRLTQIQEVDPNKEKERNLFFQKLESVFKNESATIEKPDKWITDTDASIITVRYQSDFGNGEIIVWGDSNNPDVTYARYQFDKKGKKTIKHNFHALLKSTSKENLSWSNCLYFSVVTSTTVGSGDIVPKSNTAKIAVMLQIFYGLMTIGVLVNLLSKSFEEGRSKPKKPDITKRKK